MAAAPRTAYVFEEKYLWHDPGSISFDPWTQPGEHWENKDTKHRLHSLLCSSGVADKLLRVRARFATREEITRFHTQDYYDRVQALSDGQGGDTGELARLGPGGISIAQLSAGGVLVAVDAVLGGQARNAYCLVRPPGHHAEPDRGMGFCIFNNVVVAALHARSVWPAKRVAIVDFDVHHGNGTETAARNDSDMLFISLHQDNNYPVGRGELLEGEETTINVPLPPGSGDGAYRVAFERVVKPAIDRFKPDLILVSSGFDAAYVDPLGSMMLHSESYRWMTRELMALADRHCNGAVVFAHEGGYSKEYVPFCGLAIVEELCGERADECVDSVVGEAQARGYQDCQAHQLLLIRDAARAAGLSLEAPPCDQEKLALAAALRIASMLQ